MMTDLSETDGPLDDIFNGPAKTRFLLPILRGLPPTLAGGLLAALAVGYGAVGSDRLVRAFRWAGAQGYSGWARQRLTLALLANHGRFVAQEAMLGTASMAELRAASDVIGVEHLRRLQGGGLLLGMHLGPPRAWLILRSHGYPVRFAVREGAGEGPAWERWREQGIVVPLPLGDAAARVQGLYRIRRLLGEGQLVFIPADGPLGAEVFRIDLPGFAPIIRSGWFTLRRQLKIPTLPMLLHEGEGGRRVVTIFPPLPDVAEDAGRDAEACREALTPLLRDYVRQYPAQCRYLAFPPWA